MRKTTRRIQGTVLFLAAAACALALSTFPAAAAPVPAGATSTVPAAAAPPSGRIFLSTKQLQAMGIPEHRLGLGAVSRDGSLLVTSAYETDARRKARGEVVRMYFTRLDWASGSQTTTSMVLPTTQLDQSHLSPDNKTLVGIGDAGTTFFVVDVPTLTARVIFKNQRGRPGFRSLPQVMWWEGGRPCTVGYFYDENQLAQGDAIAAIDPAGTGLEAFTRVADISGPLRKNANYTMAQWYDSKLYFLAGLHRDKKLHLLAYMDGSEVAIDQASFYGGWAVGADKILFLGRYEGERRGAFVYDLVQKRKWALGDAATTYAYPYMSLDGSTILVSRYDRVNGEMATWFGREEEGYRLHPVPGLDRCATGVIRFSPGGEVLAFYNPDGLLVMRLPKRGS